MSKKVQRLENPDFILYFTPNIYSKFSVKLKNISLKNELYRFIFQIFDLLENIFSIDPNLEEFIYVYSNIAFI